MTREKKVTDKKYILYFILVFFILLFMICFPFVISFIIEAFFPFIDAYLLVEVIFSFFGFVFVLVLGIFLLKGSLNNKRKKITLREIFIKSPKAFTIFILIIFLIESVILYRGSLYIKDIIQGPEESILTDAAVDYKFRRRGGSIKYIIGYIDGQKVKLRLTRDAYSINKNKKIKMIKIKYYKNIEKVIDYTYMIEYDK